MRRGVAAACAVAVSALAAPASAADYAVVSRCEWTLKTTDDGANMLLVVVVSAEATGPLPAATTTVTCVARTVYRETLTATATSLGPRVVAASSRVMRYDPPVVCSTSEGLWLEGDATLRRVSEAEHCEP